MSDILDSRVKDSSKRGLIRTPWGQSTPVYCANCGQLGGIALNEAAVPLLIYICDLCDEKSGKLPGLEEVCEETIRQFFGGRDVTFAK